MIQGAPGAGHIADDAQHLGKAAVHKTQLVPGAFRVLRLEGQLLRRGQDTGHGSPQIPGGQGKGPQLPGLGRLIHQKIVRLVLPLHGGAENAALQIQGQVQAAAGKGGVFLPAGMEKPFNGHTGLKQEPFGSGIAGKNAAIADAEAGSGDEIQQM